MYISTLHYRVEMSEHNSKIQISASIEPKNDYLVFRIADQNYMCIHQYFYPLRTHEEIICLCKSLTKRTKLELTNYYETAIITDNYVEFKTRESTTKKEGYVNLRELYKEIARMLYINKYIDFSFSFVVSENIIRQHKYHKCKFTPMELLKKKFALKKRMIISPTALKATKLKLKKVQVGKPKLPFIDIDLVLAKIHLRQVSETDRCTLKNFYPSFINDIIAAKNKLKPTNSTITRSLVITDEKFNTLPFSDDDLVTAKNNLKKVPVIIDEYFEN